MRDALKDNSGVTFVARLRTLITKLDNYKDLQHSMKKHLCYSNDDQEPEGDGPHHE